MREFVVKLIWQGRVFFVKVPQGLMELYSLSIGNDVSSPPKQLVTVYNITQIIVTAFNQLFPGVALLTVPAEDSLQTLHAAAIEVQLAELGTVSVHIFGENLDVILGNYYAAKLSLEHVHRDCVATTVTIQARDYTVSVLPVTGVADSEKWFVRLNVRIDGKLSRVFIAESLAEHIYYQRYPDFIPFLNDQHHLELVVSVINLYLHKLLKQQIEVVAVSLNRVIPGSYIPIHIVNNDINTTLLVDAKSSLVRVIKQYLDEHRRRASINSADTETPAEPLVDMDMKIDLPVIKHKFELTLTQIMQLKTNDVILGINAHENNHDLQVATLQCGDKIINATIDTNTNLITIKK